MYGVDTMALAQYYENIIFEEGHRINITGWMNMDANDQLHWHPYEELVLSLSDHNSATVNFIDYHMHVGDLLVINPGDLHSLHCEKDDDWLILQFPQDPLSSFADLNQLFLTFSGNHYVAYDPKDAASIRRVLLLREMETVYHSNEHLKEVKVYSLLLNFFAELGTYWISSGMTECAKIADSDYDSTKFIAEVCLYISENCAEHLTLDDVARHAGVSKSHFSHLFKSYTNMTFVEYLTAERIRRAEALSRNPSRHIMDIAFEVGFSSISSFNRAFRKVKGISPTEFREKMIS